MICHCGIIFISLMISAAEDLYTYLLIISVPLKWLLILKLGNLILCYWIAWIPIHFGYEHLIRCIVQKYFLPFIDSLFTLFIYYFLYSSEVFSLRCYYFCFYCICIVMTKKSLPKLMLWRFPLYFLNNF